MKFGFYCCGIKQSFSNFLFLFNHLLNLKWKENLLSNQSICCHLYIIYRRRVLNVNASFSFFGNSFLLQFLGFIKFLFFRNAWISLFLNMRARCWSFQSHCFSINSKPHWYFRFVIFKLAKWSWMLWFVSPTSTIISIFQTWLRSSHPH